MTNSMSQQDLLQHVLDASGTEVVSFISGGSSALVLHLQRDKQEFAAKLLMSQHNRWVDGHDLQSFRMKVKHQIWLRESGEWVRTMYPEIVLQEHGENWSWIIMTWWKGHSIFKGNNGELVSMNLFQRRLQRMLDCLAVHGYARSSVPGSVEYAMHTYVDRVRRRFRYLTKAELQPLALADHLVVNGRQCPCPLTILDAIEQSPSLLSLITPSRLYFPLHGDLNLRNILISLQFDEATEDSLYQHVQLIDPRGEITPWDVLYDIGKMYFSVSVFEALLDSTFTVAYATKSNWAEFSLDAASHWKQSFRERLATFERALQQASMFRTLVEETEPHWQDRLLFIHACHMLSESACRISRVSDQIDEHGQEQMEVQRTARDHALILYAIGSLLLYQWYQRQVEHAWSYTTPGKKSLFRLRFT